MWTLAFDITTNFCSIALLKDKSVFNIYEEEMPYGQGEQLIILSQKMLASSNLSAKDLNLAVVCTGPGSFTGLRTSITFAKSLKLALSTIQICGINAFEVYASQIPAKNLSDLNVVLIETKREDFYVAYFDKNLELVSSPKTAFAYEILADIKDQSLSIIGDGAKRFLDTQNIQPNFIIESNSPDVQTLGLLGIEKFKNNHLDFPKPLYLKAADVCIK